MIYAALVLGGLGSIPGAILGAMVMASVPEVLRTPDSARWLFYLGLVRRAHLTIRPWNRLGAVLAAASRSASSCMQSSPPAGPTRWGRIL